jgi:hypothetical protein
VKAIGLESWPVGTHWETEGGHVVERLGWGTGWCCMPANGTWEDSLVHVAHGATHCVSACHRTLVIFTWASTFCAGVVVFHVPAMRDAVVPVLKPFHRQGGEATWGLLFSVAAAVSAAIATAVAAATANVATAICAAATAAVVVAATTNVVAATAAATAAATIATAVVATTLLAVATSTPCVSWLLLWGLDGVDCLAEHLKLPLNCQDVG